MDEPTDARPEPSPGSAPAKRRWPLVVGIVVGAIVLLGLAGALGTRVFYGRTFDELVDRTRDAEGAQVWKDFFIAQDCFIDSVVEVADPELAFSVGLVLRDEADLLARHVAGSLSSFSEVSVLPFQGALMAARDSIVAHYEVWEGHLEESNAILSGLDPDPARLAQQFQAWVAVVVADADAIQSTFDDAEAAFQSAALDDAVQQEIDNLFTPSEVECSRGAV